MKSKQLERKLLHEDQAIYNSFQSHFPSISCTILALKKDYENLEIGEFNDGIYKELLAGRITEIEAKYNESLQATLTAIGPLNSQIKSNLLSNTDQFIKKLRDTRNRLISSTPASSVTGQPFPLYYITIIEGLPVLTEDNKESIKELHCRTYLQSEIEHEVYEKLGNLSAAYNALLKTFDKIGFKQHFEMNNLEQFYSKDDESGNLTIEPASIKYAIEYNDIYKNSLRR